MSETITVTDVGLECAHVEHVRYAYVQHGSDRLTVLWSTLPAYDAEGHCVVRLDPDVPPIGLGPCECPECGATVWPRIHVYDGWPPEEWLEGRAEDLLQEATWGIMTQAERLRPGLHAAHVDLDDGIRVLMSDGRGEPEWVEVY